MQLTFQNCHLTARQEQPPPVLLAPQAYFPLVYLRNVMIVIYCSTTHTAHHDQITLHHVSPPPPPSAVSGVIDRNISPDHSLR